MSSPTLDQGRIRACDHLFVSVNRNWRIEMSGAERPNAPFKGASPLALQRAATPAEPTSSWIAAIGPNDAFWLGFEAEEGSIFAVTIEIGGRSAIGATDSGADSLHPEPRNFLVVPDQPWFDAVVSREGRFAQLVPDPVPSESFDASRATSHVRIRVFPLEAAALAPLEAPVGPIPYHGGSSPQAPSATAHPWAARSMTGTTLPRTPCADLQIHFVSPRGFETATGQSLPADLFDDSRGPPPSSSPIGILP